jgi:GNAT superfamily N-acetyltransferase
MALVMNTTRWSPLDISLHVRRVADQFMLSSRSKEVCAIRRAVPEEIDFAYAIVNEYYEAARVVARDSIDEFARYYFAAASGLWLAIIDDRAVGCVALRQLSAISAAGEVKRLYVQPAFRGRGIAAALYASLENYAAESAYQWLYLDTAANMNAAQRFYATLGYELCERYNDNPQASLFMRKQLRPSPP